MLTPCSDGNSLIILNECLFVSHLGDAERVYSFFFGWKVHCLPIEICRTIKLVLGSLKCLNMTCFQRDTGCFQTWIDSVWVIGCTPSATLFSTINLFYQCDSNNHPVNMDLERKCKWTDASLLFGNESTGGVCFFFSSLNQWHNKSFTGPFRGERGHTWTSRKWTQFLGCFLSKILLILPCLFKVSS